MRFLPLNFHVPQALQRDPLQRTRMHCALSACLERRTKQGPEFSRELRDMEAGATGGRRLAQEQPLRRFCTAFPGPDTAHVRAGMARKDRI